MQEKNVRIVAVQPPKAGFGGSAQKTLRKILRQRCFAEFRNEVTPGATFSDQALDGAFERFCESHPGRKILSCFRHDGDLLAATLQRRAQNAFAFALPVDIRSVEEAYASLECRSNEMKRLSAIATENGTKSRATEPKPVLNDIRPDNAVHLRNLTLLVCIVCGAGRRKNCKGFACRQLKFRSRDHPMPSEPSVSIIVPTLNEEKYIGRAIRSLIAGCEQLDYELIVLDGGSTDRTSAIVGEMAALNSRIRLEPNPARYQSAAVNSGAKMAKPVSSVLIRADAHSEYPPGFVGGLARELRERDVASVVVPVLTRGISFLQRGVAMAQNSRLGNGGSPHRNASRSRYVEHGHHACFDRKAFLAVGGYDEGFTHNEDAELDVRLRNSGAKIWLCSELGVVYFPRASFTALAKQYFNYGSGRARTMLKHRRLPKIRQVLPLGALGVNVLSLASGLGLGWPFLLPGLAYLGACLSGGVWLALSGRDPAGCAAGPAAIVMHQSWAAGFVYRTLRVSTFKVSRLPASTEAFR